MAVDRTDSGLVRLSPAFLEALRKVVPRRRRGKLPYIVSLGLLAVVGVVGADRSTREFIEERWHHAPSGVARASALSQRVDPATPARIAPPTGTSDRQVDNVVAPVASASENTAVSAAPEKAAKAKRTRPRRAAP
jgi:hypothetical protein